MKIDRLTIKGLEGVKDASVVLGRINYVSPTVASVIALLINNSFVTRKLGEPKVSEGTYLSISFSYGGESYSAKKQGFNQVTFYKNGQALAFDELKKEEGIVRPYREDNCSLFMVSEREDFLDYTKFMPLYLEDLYPYNRHFYDFMAGRSNDSIAIDRNFYAKYTAKEGFSLCKFQKGGYKRLWGAGECDMIEYRYHCFITINNFLTYYRNKENLTKLNTPMFIEGVLGRLDEERNYRSLYNKTLMSQRQAFFIEDRDIEKRAGILTKYYPKY